jgi:hypothetical protein
MYITNVSGESLRLVLCSHCVFLDHHQPDLPAQLRTNVSLGPTSGGRLKYYLPENLTPIGRSDGVVHGTAELREWPIPV